MYSLILPRDAEIITSQAYSSNERAGVAILAVVGFVSASAILLACLLNLWRDRNRPKTSQWQRAHFLAYVISLMSANMIQAIGSIMNLRWVTEHGLTDGVFCATQGELKNAGKIGIALWSFVIALHVFNILFLRIKTTTLSLYMTLIGGWAAIFFIATVGPAFIQTEVKGPYFGVSGYWCWITDNYPEEQTFLEYFFEFLSAGLGSMLYTLTLLRVRGNLVAYPSWIGWKLRWVPREQAWRLSFARDMIDQAMMNVVKRMVWFPIIYGFAIIPIALARISEFTGHHVPFWAVIVTDTIFNLTGFMNAILFLLTSRILPDLSELPSFDTPRSGRKKLILSESTLLRDSVLSFDKKEKVDGILDHGISPFILPPAEVHLIRRVTVDV